ncbi:MAG: protein kinase [Acidobacteriota bacterium]
MLSVNTELLARTSYNIQIVENIGRYQVTREVGRGAMGIVYAAWDPLIGRTVAIKTINMGAMQAGQTRDELRLRLRREAQSAGVLSHPGIVTVYDIGEKDEKAYIVMEFVDGITMEEVFSSGVPQHRRTLLGVLNKAAAALDYAHSKGVIHRDIKPSNIMVCHAGTVKIADFGVAKISESTGLTQAGFVVGTPNYMSPEQAQGRQVDGHSDQFSLAVVAFRMLTGKLPFDGPTLTAVLTKILWEEPEYVSTNLGPEIQAVFKKALSKEPAHRYPDCSGFTRDLEAASEYHQAELSGRAEERSIPSFHAHPTADGPLLEKAGPGHQPQESSAVKEAGSTTSLPPGTVPEEVTTTMLGEAPAEARARSAASGLQPAAASVAGNYDASGLFNAPPPGGPDSDAGRPDLDSTSPLAAKEHSSVAAGLTAAQVAEPQALPEAPARKPVRLVWIAVAGLLVIAVVIVLVRTLGTRESIPLASAPQPPSIAQSNDTAAVPAAPEVAKRTGKASEPSAGATPPVVAQPAKADRPSAPKTVATRPAPAKGDIRAPIPMTGILTWTGPIGKNTILTISPKGANFGVLTGKLPGVPVAIRVEPKDVNIRLAPAQDNGWSLIILYSGKQKYNSITIYWTLKK